MPRYGTCEVFFVELDSQQPGTCFWNPDDEGPIGPGWFYWCCLPGCLPEGDPIGPFKTQKEATLDAINNGYMADVDEYHDND